MAGEAFFSTVAGEYHPREIARGPWVRDSLHGRVLMGLFARELERTHGAPEFGVSRMTVELFRVPPFLPLSVESESIRQGNRIRVVDGVIRAGETEVARSRAVMLRRTQQPPGKVWGPPAWDAPSPERLDVPDVGSDAREPMWETRAVPDDGAPGTVQKRAWLRETRELVEGEPLTPLIRAALAADFTNPFANSGSEGLSFVNADITLHLHRYPVDEWLGFEVSGHDSSDGVAVAACRVFDRNGVIGRSAVCAVSNDHRAR
jgi:hypothetical protein